MTEDVIRQPLKTRNNVLRVLQATDGEMAQAEAAAADIITGLKFLNTISQGDVVFSEVPQVDNASIVIELNFPKAPRRAGGSLRVTINPAGNIFLSALKTDASEEEKQQHALNDEADGEPRTLYNDMVDALDKAVTVFVNKYVPDDDDEMQFLYRSMRAAMTEVHVNLMFAYERAETSNPWNWDLFNEIMFESLGNSFGDLVSRLEQAPNADQSDWEWSDFRKDMNEAVCGAFEELSSGYQYGIMPIDMGMSTSVNRLDAVAALIGIAKRAVLYGLASSSPEAQGDAANPLHKAVLDGVYFGSIETGIAEEIAAPFSEGFALLEELSNGEIRYDAGRVLGTSEFALWIGPNMDDDEDFDYFDDGFPLEVMTINAGGVLKYEGDEEEFAADDAEILSLFTNLGKSGVLSGRIPATLYTVDEEASLVTRAVYEGCQQGVQEIIRAQIAAADVIATAEEIKSHLGKDFDFAVKREPGSSDVIVILNPEGPAPVEIITNVARVIKIGKERFDGLKEDDIDIVQTQMTKAAAHQRQAMRKGLAL